MSQMQLQGPGGQTRDLPITHKGFKSIEIWIIPGCLVLPFIDMFGAFCCDDRAVTAETVARSPPLFLHLDWSPSGFNSVDWT